MLSNDYIVDGRIHHQIVVSVESVARPKLPDETAANLRALRPAGSICIAAGAGDAHAADKDESKELAKLRLEVAMKGFDCAETVHASWFWSDRILLCELALNESTDSRITALENQLKRTEKLEKTVVDGQKQDIYTMGELMKAKYTRLTIRFRIEQERNKKSAHP